MCRSLRLSVDAESFPEQEQVSDLFNLLQPGQFLQFPLVIKNEGVAAGPPAV